MKAYLLLEQKLVFALIVGFLLVIGCSKPSSVVYDYPVDNSPIVYVTNTGEKYHTSGCGYLKYSAISIRLNDAKLTNKTRCSVCKPPF